MSSEAPQAPGLPVYTTHPTEAPRPFGTGISPEANPVSTGQRPITQGVAILALILNIMIWPGLGSLIAGENVGWAQGFLFLVGIPLSLVFVGIPMVIGAWIWGIVTGAELLRRAT